MSATRSKPRAQRILYFLSFAILFVFSRSTSSEKSEEICQSNAFKAKCWNSEVIVMKSALYGRMEIGKCVVSDLGHVGCRKDVLGLADRWCSGRRACNIAVPNADLDNTQPCFPELKTYLQVNYTCEKVASTARHYCISSDFIRLSPTSGAISSLVASEEGCGRASTPWLINSRPGERVQVRLLDFDTSETQLLSGTCRRYAELRERVGKQNTTVCRGHRRERLVLDSFSGPVEIRLTAEQDDTHHFILRYKVSGCADLVPDATSFFERTQGADTALVGCKQFRESNSTVRCRGGKWHGSRINCTLGPIQSKRQNPSTSLFDVPYALSVAIILGVAVLIGILILIVGLTCFARHKARSRSGQAPITYSSRTGNYREYGDTCEAASPEAKALMAHVTRSNEYGPSWLAAGAVFEHERDCPYASRASLQREKLNAAITTSQPVLDVTPPLPPQPEEGPKYIVFERGSDKEEPDVLPIRV